uniref:Fetuin B n=1 Tax=Podarcis muralis TaxID=64176 RepID=A0A670I755_PODMU|nr:fetuin-B-like [Podarcis muralis]
MALLISFLVGIQVLCSLAGLPPRPGQLPRPPLTGLLSPGCNNSVVKAAAAQALDWINSHEKKGYVLGLQRIFDARQLPQEPEVSKYFLTLDVLETVCHVLSGKQAKDCSFRSAHETVYGQCKVTVYADNHGKVSQLCYYDCVLRPLSSRAIAKVCPDCPVPGDPTEARFQEAAAESLAKFNLENNHAHYFAILNVTKARSQWVIGPSNAVEYTIQETSCTKGKGVPDISNCELLPRETAETGLCRGSVVNSRVDNQKYVSAQCELYPPKPLDTDDQNPQPGPKPGQVGHSEDHKSSEELHHQKGHGDGHGHNHGHSQGHGHSHGHGRGHGHGNRRHHHKHHGNHSHEHQSPPGQPETPGRVVVLPPSNEHVSLHSLPEIQPEQLDGEPVPPGAESPTGTPQVNRPGAPGKPLAKPNIFAFPVGFSNSATCPGDSTITIPGVELPQRPMIKLPPEPKKA